MKTLNKNLVKKVTIGLVVLFSFGNLNAQSTKDHNLLGPLGGNALFGSGSGGNGTTTGLFNGASTGFNNTFLGINAGTSTTTGNYNTFVGTGSGLNCISTLNNTFLGSSSGGANTGGGENTFLGANSGVTNTTGSHNTYTGFESGSGATGSDNTYTGHSSGRNASTASANTYNGYYSGHYATGSNNTLMGYKSGYYAIGDGNVFSGNYSGYLSYAGTNNTFIGNQSGYSNDDGDENVFVGLFSGYSNDHGDYNAFLGSWAGYNNTSGDYNAFVGQSAGDQNNTGYNNAYMGYQAGKRITTGNSNACFGYNAGQGTGMNQASSGLILIGANANPTSGGSITFSNAGAIGKDAEINVDNAISIGQLTNPTTIFMGYKDFTGLTAGSKLYVNGSVRASNVLLTSDAKLKTNVKSIEKGLDVVKRLNPVSYDFKQDTKYILPTELQFGFIAQELQRVLPNVVMGTGEETHTVDYIALIPILTKAIQEQQISIEQNKLENTKLNQTVQSLEDKLDVLAKSVEDKNKELVILENKLNVELKSLQNKFVEFEKTMVVKNEEVRLLENKLSDQTKFVEDKINEISRNIVNLNSCCEMNTLNKSSSDIKNISTITLNAIARLDQNKPNPFTSETFIDYYIPMGSNDSKIEIFDQIGKKVMTFNITNFGEGRLIVKNGGLATGIYNYSLIIGNRIINTYKMQILND